MAQTKAIDLINPEVMEDAVSAKLGKKIRFAPYARIDDKLVGTPGDSITRPRYGYVGPAEDLVEGVPMDPAKLSMTTTKVTIKEAGRAVAVTEKAILTNLNGTVEEAENQILLAMSDKMEIDYLATLATTKLKFTGTATSVNTIIDSVDLFGDEDAGDYILFIHTKDYTKLVKSLMSVGGDVAKTAITKASVAELAGVKDIVKTNRLTEGTSYLQKQGAVEIVYKKRVNINKDYDILTREVILAGNQYYVTNLYNESGVVKISAT